MSSPIVEDQNAIVQALGDARAFGADGAVEKHETHGAIVFLAGDRAFKMKRAVRYPYMDFGTLERRLAMCRAETLINRNFAPDLYLGIAPVLPGGETGYRVGSLRDAQADPAEAAAVEWLVVMRRFDNRTLFSHLADEGRLEPRLLTELAVQITRLHRQAERSQQFAGAAQYGASIATDIEEMRAREGCLDREATAVLAHRMPDALQSSSGLIERRRQGGAVRRCHGDLHLRNVCLFEGRPTPFDAIEFSPRIGTIDVLYDLAFLLMDLDHRGLRDSANLVLNNWLWRIDDVAAAPHLEALALLPLFLARRAAIRAHVDAAAAELHAGADGYEARCAAARAYQHRAASYLESRPPRLIAVGGLSGSGKTTLAMALAAKIGRAPGAVVLRSDVERKRLAGIPLEDRLAAGSYTPEASRRIYDRLLHAAEQALAGGQSVIIDAVSARPEERHEIADRAQRLAVPLTGLWLDVPLDIAVARVGARSGDASDAGPEVVRRQQAYELGTIDWHRIEAGGSIERTVAQARALISN